MTMKIRNYWLWVIIMIFVFGLSLGWIEAKEKSMSVDIEKKDNITEPSLSSDTNREQSESESLTCDDFHYLCQYGSYQEIKEAIEKGADIDCKDELGWTPLISAVTYQPDPKVIHLLVEAGADVDETDWDGMNALMAAAEGSDVETVKYLIENGAKNDINTPDWEYGFTPLLWAAKNNEKFGPQLIETLIENGADMNTKDKMGFTPLLWASIRNAKPDVIRTLIQSGADINQKGPKNVTPLMCAVTMNSNLKIVDTLLDLGADATQINDEGKKAVDYAYQIEKFKATDTLKKLEAASGVVQHSSEPSPTTMATTIPSPSITYIPSPTPTTIENILPTPIPPSIYDDPSGKFTLALPLGFSFITYVAQEGTIGANYRTPDDLAILEIRSFPSPKELQRYLIQTAEGMTFRGESTITAHEKTGKIKVYSKMTENGELLNIGGTYEGMNIALSVIGLPILMYQSSSSWLLPLFKGLTWEGKTPIVDGRYIDPSGLFIFTLPDNVTFLYSFKEDFYYNQPVRGTPAANGMVGSTPGNGQVIIANFSSVENYEHFLSGYEDRVQSKEYQIHGSSTFDANGIMGKTTLYSYMYNNQKRAELLTVYEGTRVVILVQIPADSYQAAQNWLLPLFKSVSWEKEESIPVFSPQPTRTPLPSSSPQLSATDLYSQGVDLIEQNKYQEAIPLLKQAITIQPDFGLACGELAYSYIQLEQYEKVVSELSGKLLQKTEYSTAYNLLGWAYENLDKLGEALNAYQLAVQLDPGYATAYANIGYVCNKLEKYQEAVDAFKQSLNLKPGSPYVHNNLGIAYEGLGKYDAALQSYQEAIRLKPDYANAYTNLGYVYYYQDQNQEAVDAFQKAIQLNPDDEYAYYYLGLTYLQLNDKSSAQKQYEILKTKNQSLAEKLIKKINP